MFGKIMCGACRGTAEETCVECGGDGIIDGDTEFCDLCAGAGHVPCSECEGIGDIDSDA